MPLIITMIVAIVTVYWENGFEAGENGFEIPLYYIIYFNRLWFWQNQFRPFTFKKKRGELRYITGINLRKYKNLF
jgi:hypothetical protein